MKFKAIAAVGCTLALMGCDVMFEGYGDPAPALVNTEAGVSWENLRSFGAVPDDKVSMGNEICSQVKGKTGNALRVIAYHPDAKGVDGALLPNGGFLCGL